MEKDFHFYCIAVLARAAGFNSGDALRIAYASQYVDDSTESEPLAIEVAGGLFKFDPVMTSHAILDAKNLDWSDQKRVWLPFHFLPAKALDPENPEVPYEYKTCRNSSFGNLLLREAAKKRRNKLELLVSVGAALHVFADGWAHEGFSGRTDKENDVRFQSLACLDPKTGEWRSEPVAEAIIDLSPKVGHAQCGHYPDIPYLTWRWEQEGRVRVRQNDRHFLDAARKIYNYLARVRDRLDGYRPDPIPGQGAKTGLAWQELSPLLEACLAYAEKDLEKRCGKWENKFIDWFQTETNNLWDENPAFEEVPFRYNAEDCRRDIFIGNVDWKSFKDYQGRKFALKKKRDLAEFLDSFWAHFHRAALRQRHFVLENIP